MTADVDEGNLRLCFLPGSLGFSSRSFLGSDGESSLAVDGAQLAPELRMLIRRYPGEFLSGDTRVKAESVDPVPVGGIDAGLLHQLEGGTALFAEFLLVPALPLEGLAATVIFLHVKLSAATSSV